MEKESVGADRKWNTFKVDYVANFGSLPEIGLPAWEQFARSSDFLLTKQAMRHVANAYLNAKMHNINMVAKPGLAEFQRYYESLLTKKENDRFIDSNCEYCHGRGYATAVENVKNNGATKALMRHVKYGVYPVENPVIVDVPCFCEAGRAKTAQDSECPTWWPECLFKGRDALTEARDYAEKCQNEYFKIHGFPEQKPVYQVDKKNSNLKRCVTLGEMVGKLENFNHGR